MEERTHRKLVALLGRGNPKDFGDDRYDRVRYAYRDPARISRPTPLVQAALIELVGGFDDVVLIGTEDVRSAWNDAKLLDLLGCPSRFLVLPSGAGGADLWKTFEILLPELRDLPSSAGDRPTELHVDITHGFRAQSLLVTSALTFATSEWRRQGLEQEPAVFVTYGAYEARSLVGSDAVVPIWDLGPLLFAAQWNSAIDAFVRHGRADDFEALAKRISSERQAALPRDADRAAREVAGYPRKVGEAARRLADDLVCLRLKEVQTTSAPALAGLLDGRHAEVRAQLERDFPPLGDTLARVEGEVRKIGTAEPLTPAAVASHMELARLYLRTERYAELAATLREGLAHYAHQAMGSARQGPSETEGPSADESDADRVFGGLSSRAKTGHPTPSGKAQEALASQLGGEGFVDLCRLCDRVGRLRNDVLHAGLNENPSSSEKIRRTFDSTLLEAVERTLRRLAEVTSNASIPAGAS